MPPTSTRNQRIRTISGQAFIAMVSALILGYLGVLAWRMQGTLGSSLGDCTAVGLASLHAFQALAFDHSLFLSIALRMLVLFSALIVTLTGIALLPKRPTGAVAPRSRVVSAQPKGDQ
jgi:hypothetical protein